MMPGALHALALLSGVTGIGDTTKVPRFDRVLLLDTFADTSANASIADLNGDGHLDILLVKGRHWPVRSRVMLGDGRGHFQSAHNLSETAYRSYSGRLVDLDGDGHLDVVLSNDAPDPKVTFLNDGTGHFHPGSPFGRPEWETRNTALADLNGDGLPDIVVANRMDSAVAYVCLNRGKGRFDGDCGVLAPASTTTITPGDFNRDGRIDLAVPHRDRGQSYVYLNGGNAAFPNEKRIPFGPPDARIRVAEVADFNGDGTLDLVVIDEAKGVAIYFGMKGGGLAPGVALDNGKVTPYALAVGDLNKDGKVDIIVGNVEAPSVVYFNDGSGRTFAPLRFGDNKGVVYGFAIADLDRNGLADIVVARSDAPSLVHFGDPPIAPSPSAVESCSLPGSTCMWWVTAEFVPRDSVLGGIPVDRVHSDWERASFLARAQLPPAAATDPSSLADSSATSFTRDADFNADGVLDRAGVGVYRTRRGELGRFLLVMSPASGSRAKVVFIKLQPGRAGFSVLNYQAGLLTWATCMECDNFEYLTWSGGKYRLKNGGPSDK